MKRMWVVFLLVLSVYGCATVGTVSKEIENPFFQQENQPVRSLRLLVYSDGTYSDKKISECLSRVSSLMEKQVGMNVTVSEWKYQNINGGVKSSLKELWSLSQGKDFDIAMAFERYSPLEFLSLYTIGFGYYGVIDDTYRRYVVIKKLDEFVILHELFHAFIFDVAHGGTGIMQGLIMTVHPVIPVEFNKTVYLDPEHRKEILRNKWRDFTVKPNIPEEDRRDVIASH